MSGPRRRKPRKPGFTRRDFLRHAGAGVAVLGAAPLMPGCGNSSVPDGGRTPDGSSVSLFKHGVASGDPLADRVILWTRVTPLAPLTIPVRYVLATDPQFKNVMAEGSAVTDASRDYTVKVDPAGLAPNTTYYYRFSALGQDSPIGRTKTLPADSINHLRLAMVACASYPHGFFNAYRRIAQRPDLDAVIHLGDYIYEYAGRGLGADPLDYGDGRAIGRAPEPQHEVVTLEDYRTRHAFTKQDADLQALHLQHPLIAIWDDHEFADNAWKDGALNHQPEDGGWPVRKQSAMQAYFEWMPIRDRADGSSKIERVFRFGDLADLIMLDDRVEARDQQLPGNGAPLANTGFTTFTQTGAFADPSRTLLGATQEQWFFGQLRASSARWKLVGQGVMFGQLKLSGSPNATGQSQYINNDQWDGYSPARDRVFNVLKGDGANPPVSNVCILTGDIHTSWAMDLTPDPNNSLSYDPSSGSGSLAVEFVVTSVTSPGLEGLADIADTIRTQNPHIKYVDFARKGYVLLDITREAVNAEWWYVDSVTAPSPNESFGAAFAVAYGTNHLVRGVQTQSRSHPPDPAP